MSKKIQAKRLSKKVKLRVENALRKRKKIKDFYPSEAIAETWFRIFNRSIFDSKLPSVPIYITNCPGYWGQCVATWDNRYSKKGTCRQDIIPYHNHTLDFYIQLRKKFPTWKYFVETLIHEMVHLWQMTVMKDPYSNHNANFYSWRPKLEQLKLKL
jgi:hypothetical protein